MFINARAIIEQDPGHGLEILLQTRDKPIEAGQGIELPGGRIEEFEPVLQALHREVFEETGLTLTYIEGQETRIEAKMGATTVECVRPFAVYQTTKGPIDSIGMYFRCRATGALVATGDGTKDIRWIPIPHLQQMLTMDVTQFCWIDLAGILFYLKHCHQWELPNA